MTKHPRGRSEAFMWGAATAAHQVEGGNCASDCWALEHAEPSYFKEPSGDAIMHCERFEQDIALLAALGLNAYRFSVEWARVEPECGVFSTAALEKYRTMAQLCLRAGLAPIVTLHHFTSPRWLARRGGWCDPATAQLFARYAEKVGRALHPYVETFCTINEINLPMQLALSKALPPLWEPGAGGRAEAAQQALGAPCQSMFLFAGVEAYPTLAIAAHQAARDCLKTIAPDANVGMTMSIQEEVADSGAEAMLARRRALTYAPFYRAARDDDFLGVQTYTRVTVDRQGEGRSVEGERTGMGYEYRPEALKAALLDAANETGRPLVVTENGYAGDDDQRRCSFISSAVTAMREAQSLGADVRGYLYWSAFDNFEWLLGYGPRFGIIAVDRSTQRRRLKQSAFVLASHASQIPSQIPAA